jgi:Cu(I)/Ag(I) efflux system membrane fusion protein
VDAVVDSGVKKTVYVDKGEGVFEPRRVETGWRAGGQVEIIKGLMPGEKIVVSGTFLMDSESRMKAAAAGIYGESSEDPVCGMEVDRAKAKASGLTSEFRGQAYYFSSADCKNRFDMEPAKYASKSGSR